MTRLDGFESVLWLLAAWQSIRVARHLRGGVLAREFWWIGSGFALAGLAKVLTDLVVMRVAGPSWSGRELLETIFCGLNYAAWLLVGIGAFRLRRAIESI